MAMTVYYSKSEIVSLYCWILNRFECLCIFEYDACETFYVFFLIDRVIICKLFAIILLCKFIQAYIYAHKPIDFFVKVSIKFWWSKIKSYTPCLVKKKMFRIVHAVKNFVVSMHFSRLYATLSRWIK